MENLLFPLIFFALMWLLLVRPQQQRIRKQRELLASIQVGDRVITVGGVLATVVAMDDDEVRLEVAPGTVLTFIRPAISRRVEPEEQAIDARDESEA